VRVFSTRDLLLFPVVRGSIPLAVTLQGGDLPHFRFAGSAAHPARARTCQFREHTATTFIENARVPTSESSAVASRHCRAPAATRHQARGRTRARPDGEGRRGPAPDAQAPRRHRRARAARGGRRAGETPRRAVRPAATVASMSARGSSMASLYRRSRRGRPALPSLRSPSSSNLGCVGAGANGHARERVNAKPARRNRDANAHLGVSP
jgi:hypothetical protein